MEHDILIDENGDIAFVYDDELATVFDGEPTETKRASHVEPADGGGWIADMRPSLPTGPTPNGWLLGPFKTRAEALAAERDWLRRERGL